MPRYPRVFVPTIPLHIVQRGHNRQPVFLERSDFEYYLVNLAEVRGAYGVKVHAFCLMTNHVHLLLTPGSLSEAVSAFMRVLAARQTRFVNKREGRTGTLWEGRFKASPIDSSAYMLACYRYIELNPVRANMVAHPRDYEWSSYRHNVGDQKVDWLDRHEELLALGEAPAAAYRQLVAEGVSAEDTATIRTALKRNQVTGNDKFRASLAARLGRRLSNRAPGRPRK